MLPSWIPGSYLLREFARFLVDVGAEDDEGAVPIEQTGKGSWVVTGARGGLVVRTTVYAYDLSVRGAYFDRERAFFNGTSLFLVPEGAEAEPVELLLERPESAPTQDWRVATAMRAVEVDSRGFGRYAAADYDELIDHPFEIGSHAAVEFVAAGVPHRLVIAGRINADLDRIATDLSQLCASQIEFFGRPAPFASYTFLALAVGSGFGGLEHRASSSLIFCRNDLPKIGESGVPRDYQRFLALVSHEYFHSWHVKRSKPAAFMPYRLDRRNHTRLLWVFEGITSYYQEVFLLRSGLLGREAFLRRLAELVTRVRRVPGRFRQSLAASSFNAWDHLYKPDANSVNAGVSYYSKGALIAMALDLTLRRDASSSLDDVIRRLWQRYGSRNIGLPEDGFTALAVETGGEPIREFLAMAIEGTADPDLAGLLAGFGLRLQYRQAEGPKDTGGTPVQQPRPRLALGAGIEAHASGIRLVTVLDGQAAQSAGLAPGDIIVALDRIQATAVGLDERLARYEEGDEILVTYFRADELRDTTLRCVAAPDDTAWIAVDPAASPQALARLRDWLGV